MTSAVQPWMRREQKDSCDAHVQGCGAGVLALHS